MASTVRTRIFGSIFGLPGSLLNEKQCLLSFHNLHKLQVHNHIVYTLGDKNLCLLWTSSTFFLGFSNVLYLLEFSHTIQKLPLWHWHIAWWIFIVIFLHKSCQVCRFKAKPILVFQRAGTCRVAFLRSPLQAHYLRPGTVRKAFSPRSLLCNLLEFPVFKNIWKKECSLLNSTTLYFIFMCI